MFLAIFDLSSSIVLMFSIAAYRKWPLCGNIVFPYIKELLSKKSEGVFGSYFFPFKVAPIWKRGTFEENHCSFQENPLMYQNI